jgi:DNA-binding NarL/FixJ family response regulator
VANVTTTARRGDGTDSGTENAPERVRVLLVDDDPLVRRALREALGRHPGFTIAGEATTGEEAVELALVERPDVVLMDIDMPGADGVTATARLTRALPEARVVMFSTREDEELGLLGLRAGAEGFLTKDTGIDALARSLTGVVRGEAAISRRLTRRLVHSLRGTSGSRAGMRPVKSTLTSREWQVLDLMSSGQGTEEIAETLVLSIETVRSHVKHILAKLEAHSRAEAIEIADRLRERPGPSRPEGSADDLILRREVERLLHQRGERS